ncbi:oxidoreductase, partial [mine drainage metagenome]
MGPNRYVRTPIPEDPGEERADHFEEILHPYTREEAILEGQRCLECGMPYCVQACPITQDCRGYNILVGQGKFDEAARLTLRDNPLAAIL